MSDQVHSGYVHILEDMLNERKFERDLDLAESLRHSAVLEDARTFPIWILLLGVLIGVLISCGAYFVIIDKQKPVTVTEAPVVHDSVAQEMGLMKQILTGLVSAVETLEHERARLPETGQARALEERGKALRVITERANLRERPDKEARNLVIVPKNTLLLSEAFKDGWYRVTTPLGVTAWVFEEAVSIEEVQ